MRRVGTAAARALALGCASCPGPPVLAISPTASQRAMRDQAGGITRQPPRLVRRSTARRHCPGPPKIRIPAPGVRAGAGASRRRPRSPVPRDFDRTPRVASAAARLTTASRGARPASEAERALTGALAVNPAGHKAVDVRQHLIHLFVQQGRYDEAPDLLRRQWHGWSRHTAPPRRWPRLRRNIVERPRHLAPDRPARVLDRDCTASPPATAGVTLARANLAAREGRLDQRRRRPGRRPPGRGRPTSRWAGLGSDGLAAGRHDEAESAVGGASVPSGCRPTGDCPGRRRAARTGRPTPASRATWERLAATGPARPAVLDRLATLALADGDAPRAAELRRRKAEIDRSCRPPGHPDPRLGNLTRPTRALAELAAALGRRFEARAFLAMASSAPLAPSDRETSRAPSILSTPGE